MTRPQRWWLFGVLLAIAACLVVYHLEWTFYDQNDNTEERLALPVYMTTRPHVLAVDEPTLGLKAGEQIRIFVQHGLYVRRTRSITQGLLLGGLTPLILVGLAGFLVISGSGSGTREPRKGLSFWQSYRVKRSLAKALNVSHGPSQASKPAPVSSARPPAFKSKWGTRTIPVIGFLAIVLIGGGLGKVIGRETMSKIMSPSRAEKETLLAQSATSLRQSLPRKVGQGVTLVDVRVEGLTMKYIHEIVDSYGADEIHGFELYARQTLCEKSEPVKAMKQGASFAYEYWTPTPSKSLKGQFLIRSCS
ncbi:hypothetical protein [Microvirga tunisiensis]|uniref:Uncharacterized protein n=1 Tax=Microvirga tunisiensis TaxID=2108360 RepID=A0A5N7MJE5_9HYPH|nr:hypothetical protein [Microvirga tunisiensis]MPR06280.1 hypothetical protein [Microvirga tunisiensis]MPR24066.1 hypothetical protein [Microvirga tunisiensis]